MTSPVSIRVLEDAKKTFKGNKRQRSIEARKIVIEKQEEVIKSSQTKAMLLLEQANLLMEDSENVNLSRKRREFSNLLSN